MLVSANHKQELNNCKGETVRDNPPYMVSANRNQELNNCKGEIKQWDQPYNTNTS